MWIKVSLSPNKFIIIGVFYTPKSELNSLVELRKSITKLRITYPETPLFLGGDFNLPGINWDTLTYSPTASKKAQWEYLLNIAADFQLEQLNLEPTRNKNTLELMFTTSPEISNCSTGPGISDHDHIVICRTDVKPMHPLKKKRDIHLYKKADWNKIKLHISNARDTFNTTYANKTTEENWCFLRNTILDAIDN